MSAQNYQLNNGLNGSVITTCSGNFYDSGGPGGQYNNNQNLTVTFCPSISGQAITLNFSVLNVENNFDNFFIYDGPGIGSPQIGAYTGNVGPLIVSSSYGCITVRFTSDGSVTRPGWEAVISCSPIPLCSGTSPACPSGFPDNCATACPLALSTPVNCTSPATNVFCLDNSAATINSSSPPLMCGPNIGSVLAPYDAWYSFTATANSTFFTLYGLDDAAMTLYTGLNCGSLIPLNCSYGSGLQNMNSSALNPGQTYYLQISSFDSGLLGDYLLDITSSIVCTPCQEDATLQISPLPVNGVYQPGTTVDFCIEIEDWNVVQSNWFHGIGVELGNGWDLGSMVVNSLPASCDGDGTWMFVNSVTGTGGGLTVGPGFFYDSDSGGPLDGNPGNNWGDFCNPANQGWEFCWSLTTLECTDVGNVGSTSVSISTYGDGQTGSWDTFECDQDPVYSIYSMLDCCAPPLLTSSTNANCGLCNGSFVVTAMGIAPFSFTVTDSAGTLVTSGSGANPVISITALCGNLTYTIQVTDALGCTSSLQVPLTSSTAPTAAISGVGNICVGQNFNLTITLTGGGPWNLIYALNGTPEPAIVIPNSPYNLNVSAAGTYSLVSLSNATCSGTVSGTATVTLLAAPTASISGGGNICMGQNLNLPISLTGAGPWNLVYALNGTPQPALVVLSSPYNLNVSAAGTYTLVSVSNPSCNGTVSGASVVVLLPSPSASISGGGNSCMGQNLNLQITLTGGGPWNLIYAINGTPQPALVINSSPYNLNVSAAGTYTLVSVSNASCTGTVSGTATVTVLPNPTAAISGGGNICTGQNINLPITLTGGGPWSLVYAINGTPQPALVINSSPYNLNVSAAGTYSLVSVSNASCSGTISGSSTVTQSPVVTAAISGGGNICAGQNMNLVITLSGTGPWTVIPSRNGIPQPAIVIASSPYNLNVNQAGTYSLVSVSNASCSGTVSGSTTVTQSPLVTAAISGTLDLCTGASDDLQIVFAGTAPWTFIYAINGTAQPAISTSDPSYDLNVSQAGTYTLNSVTTALCTGTVSGTATVIIHDSPTVSNIQEICNGVNYTVSFDIQDGDAASYAVTGAGTLTGNQFISTSISSGTPYSFQVTDANACSTINVNGTLNCLCPASAVLSGNANVCAGQTGSLNVTLNGTGPWTLVYMLNGIAQAPLNIASSPHVINGLSAGTYTLSSVEDQSCFGSVSGTGTITQSALVTAAISGNVELCTGSSDDMQIALTGTAPWTFIYAINGIIQPTITTSDPSYDLNVSQAGTYTLNSVTTALCTGTVSGTATVIVHNSPTVSNIQEICNGVDYTVSFDIQDGDAASYSVTGAGTLSGNQFVSSSIPSGTPYSFQVSDVNACSTVSVNGTLNCLCPASAVLSGNVNVCDGQTGSLNVNLNGAGPWTLVYMLNGVAQAPLNIASSPYSIAGLSAGTYTLSSVEDQSCFGSVSGTGIIGTLDSPTVSNIQEICNGANYTVSFDIQDGDASSYAVTGAGTLTGNQFISSSIPSGTPYSFQVSDVNACSTVSVNGKLNCLCPASAVLSGNVNVCTGQTGSLNVTLNGTGPWSLVYMLNGVAQTALNIASSPYTITGLSAGTYTLSSVEDQSCFGSVSGTGIIGTLDSPTVSNIQEICNGVNYTVSFDIQDGDASSYAVSGLGTLTGNQFVSASIPSGTPYSFQVSDANACSTINVNGTLNCLCPASAVLSGNVNVCTGQTGSLNVTLNGTAPWTLVYMLNGIAQAPLTIASSPYSITGLSAGTYTLSSVEDQSCFGSVSGTGIIGTLSSPTVSNIQEICSGFSYTVSFDIQNGDPSTYAVTGAGTLSGSQFLSDPITSGTPYSFQISDGAACTTETVSGTVNCGCPATAVLSGGGTVCPGEDVSITFTLVGNGPWTVVYTQDGIAQAPLNIVTSPYSLIGLSPGNYALASVMDQDCLGNISGLANIGFYPASSANLSGNETLCEGESTLFDLQLTGSAPWNISYAIDGIDQSPILTADPNFQLDASTAGLYALTSVTDLNCDASLSGLATLTILPSPSASMAGDAALCPGEDAEISIDLIGTAPFDFNYTLDGIDQGSFSSNLNSYTLTTALEGLYVLTQLSDASCSGTVSGQSNVVVHEAPTATASGNVELCDGEVGSVDVFFEGLGPWVLEYTVAGIAQDPLIMNTSPSSLTLDANGPYQLIDVSDVYCDGTADGNISVTYFPLPTAVLPVDQSYCEGEVLDWNITLSGTGPWDMLLQWNGANWQSIESDDSVIPIQTSNAGQVSIFSLSDAHCDAANLSSFEINSLDLPTASILGNDLLCEGSNGEIEVILQGSPPFYFDLNVNGLGQGNYISNTNSLVIPISQAGEFDLINLVDEFCAGELGPSLSVFAQELPNASIVGNFLLCQGTDTLIPISFSGQGPFSFDYAINGIAQGNITTSNLTYEFPSTVSGNYQLLSVSDAFCDGTVNGNASIQFYPDIDIAGLVDTSICIGSSFLVNPIISGGQGTSYEFMWSGPGISSNMSAIQLSPNENSNFTFEVNDGCGLVYSEDINVLVAPSPVLSAQVMNGPLCGPGQVFIQETSPDISDSGYCYWYAQGDTIFNCSGSQFFISGTGNIDVGFYAEPVPGCISDTVFQGFIEILELPHADFEYDPEEPSNAENIIQLIDFSADADQYEWFMDAQLFSEQQFPSLSLPFSEVPEFYTICLVTTNDNLCTDTLCTIIPTTNELLVYVPSAFTPDNDGVNDHFKPVLRSADIDKYSFSIFDRWGNIIWETEDLNAGWNGAGSEESTYYSPDGIYTWKMQVRRVGTTDERVYMGMVTLIR